MFKCLYVYPSSHPPSLLPNNKSFCINVLFICHIYLTECLCWVEASPGASWLHCWVRKTYVFPGHPLETPVGVDRSVCIHHYITVYTCTYVCMYTYTCMYYIGREQIRRKFILFYFFEFTKKNIQICM
jgi:hypothetical protein